MPGVDDFLCSLTIQPRQADIEPRLQQVAAFIGAQVDFGIDGHILGQRHFHFPGRNLHGADETG
ncbi:hypothetical protein D3C85_1873800 [compost metagenome]